MKVRLHAHPHGQQTRHEEEGDGLPAAATSAGRPQPRDHSDHQHKPGHTAKPPSGIERIPSRDTTDSWLPDPSGNPDRASRPMGMARHCRSGPRLRCHRREGDRAAPPTVLPPGPPRGRRTRSRRERWPMCRRSTLASRRRGPAKTSNQRNEQTYRCEPPEDTQPCGKRPVELFGERREPLAAVGSNQPRPARLGWGRLRGEDRGHLTLSDIPATRNATQGATVSGDQAVKGAGRSPLGQGVDGGGASTVDPAGELGPSPAADPCPCRGGPDAPDALGGHPVRLGLQLPGESAGSATPVSVTTGFWKLQRRGAAARRTPGTTMITCQNQTTSPAAKELLPGKRVRRSTAPIATQGQRFRRSAPCGEL